MSIAFSIGELVAIAVGIEKQGIAFYDVMARSTKQPLARDLFISLADAERTHMETFKNMLSEADTYTPPYDNEHEYDDYLRSLISSAVFTDESATSELATRAGSEVEALDIGIGAEKDSILFYYQMKEIMPPPSVPIIENIIREEKLHLSQLSGIKNKMSDDKLSN
ncbi:MAG: ferritin family protein [Dehalococcoidales bacterium]|nr:ferritin family protein [Dehalococcoidales bacterium]